jgi:MFS family permease
MRTLSRPASFAVVAAALLFYFFASSAPSPLYVVYQARWGFSASILTLVFAVYVVALLGALLTVGALSDHVGRRPVLAAALALEAVAMAVFLSAGSVGWLFVARVIQGIATGAAAGAISAALVDLQPASNPRLGALVNASAPGFGLAFGALSSGLLVEYAPGPTTLIFAILIAIFVLLALGVLLLGESDTRRPGAMASLRPRLSLPSHIRRPFAVATPSLLATWALGGLYLSVGPSLAGSVLRIESHVIGGLVIFVLFGMAAMTALLLRDWSPRRSMLVGSNAVAVGVAVTLVSLAGPSTALFFLGTAISGFGFGIAFQGAFRAMAALAEPNERAALFATLYTVAYLAFSLPAIVAGFAITSSGLRSTADVYGGVVIALALSAVAGMALQRRPAAVTA